MTASTLERAERRDTPMPAAARRYAFGLELVSGLAFDAVELTASDIAGPATSVEVVSAQALTELWRRREAVSVMERRYPSGRLVLSIHRHPELGYRVSAPGHGCHLVSAEGNRVLSALPPVPPWRWQRLLFAQALPLASTLRGFELFHASAVSIGGRAVGFVAASGTGKTSVAAHLVARGAQFVTDDVMALSATGDEIRVHPGAGMVAVHGAELKAMTPDARSRLGRVLGRSGKTYLAREPVGHALPLAAVYYLERSPAVDRFSISQSRPADPQLLLSSAFIWYLGTPEFLLNHLEVCARIAAAVPLFTVRIPPGVPAADVARLVERHVSAGLP